MSEHVKPIHLTPGYLAEGRKGSDFGAVFPALCSSELRPRVVNTIHDARSNQACTIGQTELGEVATYIAQLEEFILRQYWGESKPHLASLKTSTGLGCR